MGINNCLLGFQLSSHRHFLLKCCSAESRTHFSGQFQVRIPTPAEPLLGPRGKEHEAGEVAQGLAELILSVEGQGPSSQLEATRPT